MSYPPKLLLIDTCGSEASVALAEGRSILEQMQLPGRRASEGLVNVIGDLLRGRRWRLQELDAIVVVRGPGSFTGVRVGVTAAKALAEGSGRPLIAVSRLAVLAHRAATASLVMLDAGRSQVFWAQVFADGPGEQAVAPRAWVIEWARSLGLSVAGESGGSMESDGLDLQVPALTAADALPLGLHRLLLDELDDPLRLDGLYLHKTEQETLARQRRHQQEQEAGTSRP